jgi:hypothetical protein
VGSSSEEVVDSVGNAVADASGSIVKVMVAVVVERVMVAVRVMRSVNWVEEVVEERIGVLEREVEVDSRSDADREVEVDPRLELNSKPELDAVVDEDVKEEVAEKEEEDDIALRLGPTTTVVVPTPLVTTTVVVMVLRPLVLADVSRLEDCEEPVLVEETNPVDVPDEAPPVVAETLAVVDELGNKPSGMAPNTCLAFSTSVHPRIAPCVVFIGIAKHTVPGTLQGEIWNASPLVQKASPPATHAVWPVDVGRHGGGGCRGVLDDGWDLGVGSSCHGRSVGGGAGGRRQSGREGRAQAA